MLSDESPVIEASIALSADAPFTGVSTSLSYHPGFDSYFLFQKLSTESDPKLHTFKVSGNEVQFIENSHVFENNFQETHDLLSNDPGSEFQRRKPTKASYISTTAEASFQNKLYTLSFERYPLKNNHKEPGNNQTKRSLAEWEPGSTQPNIYFKRDLKGDLLSSEFCSNHKKEVMNWIYENNQRTKLVFDAFITGLGEYLYFTHLIPRNGQLLSEALLMDAALNVVDRTHVSSSETGAFPSVLSAKKANKNIILRSNVTYHYTSRQEESKGPYGTPEDDTTLFSNINLYVWNPTHSNDPAHISKETHYKIEVPRRVQDLQLAFDESSNRFYLAGSWEWRLHQTMGFLIALDEDFETLWTRTFSLVNNTTVKGLSIGKDKSVTLVGECGGSKSDTRSPISFQDIALVKFDAAGIFLGAISFGTDRQEYVENVSVTPRGDLLIAGSFDGPITHTADNDKSLGYKFPLSLILPASIGHMGSFESRIHVRTVKGGADIKLKRVFRPHDLERIQNGFNVGPHPLLVENPEAKKLHQAIWDLLLEACQSDTLEQRASSVVRVFEKYKDDIFACTFDLNNLQKHKNKDPDIFPVPNFYRDFDGFVVSDGLLFSPRKKN